MILFANGCSWTWGGGLEPYFKVNNINDDEKRLPLVWPHHLGKLLNADKVINLGAGCGSNQRTVRTTHDWFLKEYKNDEPIIAIIQITDPARYEYYLTDNFEDFSNDPLNWTKLTPSAHIFNVKDLDKESCSQSDVKVKRERDSRFSTYTLIEGMYKLISDISALAHLFESHNVEYYFFGGYFKKFIKPNYPIEYVNYFKKLHWLECGWDNVDPVSPKDMHPSLLGHQQIAELIYQIIRPKHVI